MDRLLWYLFAGSRGGPTRIRIMRSLLERPHNLNQLARHLGLDYKTVEYNLRVLAKNAVVVVDQPGTYGALYFPSKNFLAHRETFDAILRAARMETRALATDHAPANWGNPEIEPNRR